MGKLIEKVRKNLLNNTSSFKIGFGNRSPFSYQLPDADPNSGVTQIETPDMDDGTIERMEAQGAMAREMMQQAANVATKIAGSEEDQDKRNKKRLEGRQKRIKGRQDDKGITEKRAKKLEKIEGKITDIGSKEYADGKSLSESEKEEKKAFMDYMKNSGKEKNKLYQDKFSELVKKYGV